MRSSIAAALAACLLVSHASEAAAQVVVRSSGGSAAAAASPQSQRSVQRASDGGGGTEYVGRVNMKRTAPGDIEGDLFVAQAAGSVPVMTGKFKVSGLTPESEKKLAEGAAQLHKTVCDPEAQAGAVDWVVDNFCSATGSSGTCARIVRGVAPSMIGWLRRGVCSLKLVQAIQQALPAAQPALAASSSDKAKKKGGAKKGGAKKATKPSASR